MPYLGSSPPENALEADDIASNAVTNSKLGFTDKIFRISNINYQISTNIFKYEQISTNLNKCRNIDQHNDIQKKNQREWIQMD